MTTSHSQNAIAEDVNLCGHRWRLRVGIRVGEGLGGCVDDSTFNGCLGEFSKIS